MGENDPEFKMKAILDIGTVYLTESNSFQCIGRDGDAYVLRRITDDWTLTAHDCRYDENGILYWSGSSKGHWPQQQETGNPTFYYYYRTGTYNKLGTESSYWCRTSDYPTKTALLKALNPGRGYARKVTKVLTADQLLEKYPGDAARIMQQAYRR